jgi:hypothetical protein
MPTASNLKGNVHRYRERMRAMGFRTIQFWAPDTRSPEFAEECRRQSLMIMNDPAEQALMDELESMQDDTGWVE